MEDLQALVLTTRLDVLERSLKQVEGTVPSLQERLHDVKELRRLLGKSGIVEEDALILRETISESKAKLENVRRRIEDRVEDSDMERLDDALDALHQAGQAVEEIVSSLDEANSTINSMLTRAEITEDEDLGKMLQGVLVKTARDSIAKLRPIRDKLEAAREARDQTEAERLMQKAWAEYTTTVYRKSESLFSEYVDLLGGLALRDIGFDKDISRLGDELVRKWAPRLDVSWDSLTIPARQESPTTTPARIIRLGFPEWTIWALPLTAHEFGHLAISQNKELRELIAHGEPDEQTKSHRQEYAADAIATYVMGPAYACAAILLRFDPLSAYMDHGDQPAPAKRAHVVFRTLEWMDRANIDRVFEKIIAQLRKEWEAALDLTLSPDDPESLGLKGQVLYQLGRYEEALDALDRALELNPDDAWVLTTKSIVLGALEGHDEAQEVLDQAQPAGDPGASEIEKLEGWLKSLWEYLNQHGEIYPPGDWMEIEEKKWPEKLVQDPGEDVEGFKVDGTEELRDVLNAAWRCRVIPPGGVRRVDIEKIADAAWALWDRIVAERERGRKATEQRRRSPTRGPSVSRRPL
jgi:tetratricopeptide (TPR) repeat protein